MAAVSRKRAQAVKCRELEGRGMMPQICLPWIEIESRPPVHGQRSFRHDSSQTKLYDT